MTTIGFIGTGAITQAVVTGLCTLEAPPARIWVSPRNAARAKALSETFPRVSVAADNQSLLEESETVCLAVRPDIAEQLLKELRFRADQRIVSFIAMVSMARLNDLVAPATRVCRMVPLPAVAEHLGPVALCPPDESVAALFGGLGTLVQVEDEARLHALWATTSMMAPFFGALKLMSAWLEERQIAPEQARRYVASMIHALSVTGMAAEEEDFERLIVDHSTPRGLNEQALRELEDAGCYARLSEVLTLIEKRLNGRADIDSRIGGRGADS
jgi:pyrroline-5-carboxylate reductase